ncbi:chromosomal replication initiation protein [bacterium BMS3Abin07]|nr:chromosomal replication initiation protein [bacterium BMS3Abin07]GBE33012.1 chromosomal replication initiation protein [bacterium BMS3Bbin05]
MTNHYHLLVETPYPNLSNAIQWLNVSYATYFNKKHQRKGHLFQGRFKAILIEADEYPGQLSRYIHLNPVRAGMVITPGEYQWSSYPAFTGKAKASNWLQTEWILSYFDKKKKSAMKKYKNFVEEIDIKSLENPNKNVVGGFILGNTPFVDWVKDTFLSKMEEEKEIPALNKLRPKPSLERIVQAVCEDIGCSERDILTKGRKRNRAREIAIYIARDLSGLSCKELGKYFNEISGAAITMKYRQVTKGMTTDKKLRQKVNRIKNQKFNI